MSESGYKILCIEDDEDTCDLITFIFEQDSHKIEACSQKDCLNVIHEDKFSAIILDNFFHGQSGTEICREIRSFDQTTPIIFFSGEARTAQIEKALAAGANAYLVKPNDLEKLLPTTLKLIEESSTSA